MSVTETPCRLIERIEVWKAQHELRAYCADGGVLTMNVSIGRGDQDPKERSGDQRTPEGQYLITGSARASRFHLFIPIDYPSPSDAARGLSTGLIDPFTHERIVGARAQGLAPPQDTVLGGDLGLHGEGKKWQGESGRSDWTYGCIAVTDAEIERLAERVRVGMPVQIYP